MRSEFVDGFPVKCHRCLFSCSDLVLHLSTVKVTTTQYLIDGIEE